MLDSLPQWERDRRWKVDSSVLKCVVFYGRNERRRQIPKPNCLMLERVEVRVEPASFEQFMLLLLLFLV